MKQEAVPIRDKKKESSMGASLLKRCAHRNTEQDTKGAYKTTDTKEISQWHLQR